MLARQNLPAILLPALCLALGGWGALAAQSTAQFWQPALPGAPYAQGNNPENGTIAPDEPIPGFVGPAGDGVAPYYGQNEGQMVNPAFVEWASTVADYSPAKPSAISPAYVNPGTALGPVSGDVFDVVSLGDLNAADITAGVAPGTLTLGFATPIADGPGPDFAVFGNAFALNAQGRQKVFSKLAYVEVSSDGVNFARFPSVDANPKPAANTWPYMVADPTLIYNLFGKALNGYGVSWGVPFDLAQLRKSALVTAGLLDLQKIRFVRFVAVVGNGAYSADALGNPIYDPWPTTGSPGPEVQAVGVLNIASTNNGGPPISAASAKAATAAAQNAPSPGGAKANSLIPATASAKTSPFAFLGPSFTVLRNAAIVLNAADSGALDTANASASDERTVAPANTTANAGALPLVNSAANNTAVGNSNRSQASSAQTTSAAAADSRRQIESGADHATHAAEEISPSTTSQKSSVLASGEVSVGKYYYLSITLVACVGALGLGWVRWRRVKAQA